MTWQQTIDEEKDIALEAGREEGRKLGARETAIANAKNLLLMNLGTPEQICKNEQSYTGKFLKKYLE